VVTQSPENQPVQVNIAQSVAPGELPDWGLTFAGATIATIPHIILFLLPQRYFVKGLATTGLKYAEPSECQSLSPLVCRLLSPRPSHFSLTSTAGFSGTNS
jgi:hypothetical protein